MRKTLLVLTVLALGLPAVSTALITADLRYGTKGAQVRELQQFLIDQKILVGSPTGNFYSITLAGVKAFQKAVGLPDTGFVGPMTRAEINVRALNQSSSTSTPKTTAPIAASPEVADPATALIEQLQKLLDQLNGTTRTSQTSQSYATSTSSFEFDQTWRTTVVNLFCTDRYSGGISSGSGVIIDPRGIILTNAHVALDFLFQDWPTPSITECVVRTGLPASPAYKAQLMYLPGGYVNDIITAVPGAGDENFVYGKDDYAILVITGPAHAAVSMPASFPYLSLNFAPPPVNTPVYLLGYASEYASVETLQRSLYQLASPANVNRQGVIQASGNIDTIAFNGNVVGQHGSSGGAVILSGGQLAGLMTFFDKNQGQTTAEKVLNAITAGYIARDFETDTTVAFGTFLKNDPKTVAQKFMAGNGAAYQKMFAKFWRSRGATVPGYYE